MKIAKIEIEVGERFGRLVVARSYMLKADDKKRSRRVCDCVCDCGKSVTVRADNLMRGCATSCGCVRSELQSAKFARMNTHDKN